MKFCSHNFTSTSLCRAHSSFNCEIVSFFLWRGEVRGFSKWLRQMHLVRTTGRSCFKLGLCSWKTCKSKLCKFNTKFPFKTVFSGVRGLTASSCIVYDYNHLWSYRHIEYICVVYGVYKTYLYSIHTFLYNILIYSKVLEM
jgi:hypothetical protein